MKRLTLYLLFTSACLPSCTHGLGRVSLAPATAAPSAATVEGKHCAFLSMPSLETATRRALKGQGANAWLADATVTETRYPFVTCLRVEGAPQKP